jgi:hypothetical protein
LEYFPELLDQKRSSGASKRISATQKWRAKLQLRVQVLNFRRFGSWRAEEKAS